MIWNAFLKELLLSYKADTQGMDETVYDSVHRFFNKACLLMRYYVWNYGDYYLGYKKVIKKIFRN